MWYPDIPSPTMHVNTTSRFPVEENLYTPLTWVSFGGHGGSHLPYLTKITVRGRNSIESVEFHYINRDVEGECRVLEFCNSDDRFSPCGKFPIDGPGGELIQAVDMSFETSPKPQKLREMTKN